ncbi:hypothetical protein J6590_042690 [Homalodisca vitripennis]|nr:hypothetical protein J6590_042690 [Homalodisca vitripennis]
MGKVEGKDVASEGVPGVRTPRIFIASASLVFTGVQPRVRTRMYRGAALFIAGGKQFTASVHVRETKIAYRAAHILVTSHCYTTYCRRHGYFGRIPRKYRLLYL